MIPAGARLPQPQVGISRQMASFGQNVLRAVAPHAEEHRSADARAGASPAQARCDASRSMRANRVARPHPSRRAHARSSLRNVSASALLRMRTNIACCKVHHTNSPSPSRGAFAAARAGWSDPCIFLFFCGFGIFHPRSHDLKQHTLPRSRGAFPAPGVCTFASLTPNRGVGGAPRDVRVLGGTPVRYAITRRTRRLRGAFRPMTRDARLSALHRGGFGPRGRASVSGMTRIRRRAPRSQVVVPGGRLPGPPGADGYEPPAAGRHAPLRLQDRLRRRPSMSEAGNRSSIVTIRSQESS